jgi:general nucleoside transport system permease protein
MDASQFLSYAFLSTWLTASVRLSGPVLLAALGETFSERSGVLNVGIEGTILLGALSSYLVSYYCGLPVAALLAAIVLGTLANIFLAWMYVTVRASQVVVGIVFNVLALGIASFVYRLVMGSSSSPQPVAMFKPLRFPILTDLPLVGPILFGHTVVLYVTFSLVAIAAVVLFRTKFGLAFRAVGENPKAADAAGINVAAMRYIGVMISGAAAGGAGGYIMLSEVGLFRETIVSGQGFIALAIVILGRWSPWKAALAALVFGAADALQLSLQLFGAPVPPQLLLSLPYVLTILAISGLFGGRAVQPAALMIPYQKD